MPILPNPKHEAFAQCMARGISAIESYVQAGYKRNDGNCITLKGRQDVKQRVDELRAVAGKRIVDAVAKVAGDREKAAVVTMQTLTQMLLDDRALARSLGQAAAAVSAVKELGILTGVRIERSEVGKPGEFDDMSDADLRRLITDERAALGIEPRTVN